MEALMEALSLEQGIEGAFIGTRHRRLDTDNLIDLQAVSKLFGSLIRRSQSGFELELVHFTVKEFLMNISPDDHSYSQYRLDRTMADKEIAETCLRNLNLAKFSVPSPHCVEELRLRV
jgi:hypothetical protein